MKLEKYIKRLEDIGISVSLIVDSMRNDFLRDKILSASIDDIDESQKQFNLVCQKLKYLDKLKAYIQAIFKKLADFDFMLASGQEELNAGQSILGVDVKIGMDVKKKLIGLYHQKQFTDEQIVLMCDKQWSSEKFKLNYPLLKEIDESKDFSEQRYFGSYLKYWSEYVIINNKKYFICS